MSNLTSTHSSGIQTYNMQAIIQHAIEQTLKQSEEKQQASKIKKYYLIKGSREQLMEAINKRFATGWLLHGQPYFADGYHYQGMIL